MNPFRYTLQIANNKAAIERFRIAIYENVMDMGYSEHTAERIATGTLIHITEGDNLTEFEMKHKIQPYYDQIHTLRKANNELGNMIFTRQLEVLKTKRTGAKQTTLKE
jgi:hypothetical protein